MKSPQFRRTKGGRYLPLEVTPLKGTGEYRKPGPEPGVYVIRNVHNLRGYIGSAKSLSHRRADHLFMLRRRAHHCKELQREYDTFGESAFEFCVLVLFDRRQCRDQRMEIERKVIERNVGRAYNIVWPQRGRS